MISVVCMCVCVCILPMVIFRGVRILESHKQNLPAGSTVKMTESGYVNETAFLEWLQHFKKHRIPWKYLIVLVGRTSHCALEDLNYCRHDIEMLCLLLKTTQVLQSLIELYTNNLNQIIIGNPRHTCLIISLLPSTNKTYDGYFLHHKLNVQQFIMFWNDLNVMNCTFKPPKLSQMINPSLHPLREGRSRTWNFHFSNSLSNSNGTTSLSRSFLF
jgi:hypothetical protein